ncbi:hypothetical protein LNQ81_04500 [Myroides sp. M-43]|uniref:hypothetical protein n=1 Tax=Myroides oncorhynchi TaxID=2893756 RepID=UPI001E37D4A6|nr:hypothetical protein [Myroides oncorhynchi]MCC9041961.1 hypothetical protein [Myroides oncorhynchi]
MDTKYCYTNISLTIAFILLMLTTSCGFNNSIIVKGKVTLENTSTPPLGITTMNIKNKWQWKNDTLNAYGDNVKTYVNKKGYYKIKIQKGDTLVLIPNSILYGRNNKKYTYSNITKSKTLDIQVTQDSLAINNYLKLFSKYPELELNFKKNLQDSDPDTLIQVSGHIYSKKTNRPLKNVDIGPAFIDNTLGIAFYHLTNNKGEFSITIPKGNILSILALSKNSVHLSPKNDTIINLSL